MPAILSRHADPRSRCLPTARVRTACHQRLPRRRCARGCRNTAGASAGRAAPAFLVFSIATILRYLAFAASWSVIGSALLTGSSAGLTAWALLLASTVPLAALAEAAEGRTAIALGADLRRRTLRGALALDPSWVRREGPGQILGRSMEVDAIARLAAGGGLGAVTLAIELAVAGTALALTESGRMAVILLAAVLAVAGVVAAVAVRRRRAWTSARLAQTGELLEAIAGQRTRLIQGDDEAEQRKSALDDYERLGAAADRPLALLAGAVPRVALAGGLAAIVLTADGAQPADLALALGGVLLASQALRRLAVAVETLTSAVLARRQLEPILRAGRQRLIARSSRAAPSPPDDGIVAASPSAPSGRRRRPRLPNRVSCSYGDCPSSEAVAGSSTTWTWFCIQVIGLSCAADPERASPRWLPRCQESCHRRRAGSASTATSPPTPVGASASAWSPSMATTMSCWRRRRSTS